MRRLVLTIPEDALETVLDGLLPLVPAGAHWVQGPGDTLELAVHGEDGELPSRGALEAAAGAHLLAYAEEEVAEDPGERRTRYMRRPVLGGRVVVRPSDAPAPAPGVLDVVIDSPAGAFGAGSHPTTTMCLELMLALAPGGGFADLGCGTGVLAITAALLGWDPVFALDHEHSGVEATLLNAERNGVAIDALQADLLRIAPPPAPTIAANVPPAVHAHVAAGLPAAVERLIASGIVGDHLPEVVAGYGRAGLTLVEERGGQGWVAALLARG
jgi:ribosomal protein L11 methyltransferase